MFKVGIALGGGAARGLAHIGVLGALEKAYIKPHVVAGTSVGAIIGGIYARRAMLDDVKRRINEFLKGKTFQKASLHLLAQKEARQENNEEEGWVANITGFLRKGLLLSHGVTRQSLIGKEEYEEIIRALMEDVEIEKFKLPFSAVSADLISGKEVLFTRGSVRHAVMASSAIPGIFPPVEDGDKLLIDGGWVAPIPVDACRALGANFVIAVDISADLEERMDFHRSINIFLRSNSIARQKLRELQTSRADFVIRPSVGDQHWADFSKVDEVIKLGEEAANRVLKEVTKAIATKRRRRWLKL